MRIFLQRTATPRDLEDTWCGLCGAEFKPQTILVQATHGDEICDACAHALLRVRGEQGGVEADWPTWERYQQALREHPSPMMTEEEFAVAEELGFEAAIHGLSLDL